MIYGRDVKCPECGTGLVDVAPDYPMQPDPEDITCVGAIRSMHIEAHCQNGHRLRTDWYNVQGEPMDAVVNPWPTSAQDKDAGDD